MNAPIRTTLFLCLISLASAGCNAKDDTGFNGDFPQILQGIGADPACDTKTLPGDPDCFLSAATRYAAGEYVYNGTELSGKEYQYWIPNAILVQNSTDWVTGQTCVLEWDVFGVKDDSSDCAACEYRLTGSATFRGGDSNCPTELEEVEGTPFDFSYDVRNTGNQQTMYFSASGNEIGKGDGNNNRYAWITVPLCALVGSATCAVD